MDPSSSFAAIGSTTMRKKHRWRPLGNNNKPKMLAFEAPEAGGPLCIGAERIALPRGPPLL
jgi:hypothetical protein